MKRKDRKYVCPARKILRKRESLAGFHHFYVAQEKWSGQNRISHPHWVKICSKHNSQINVSTKQKYEVLSATVSIICYLTQIILFNINHLFAHSEGVTSIPI